MMPVRKNQHWLPGIFNDFFGNEWVDKSNVTAPAVNILETEDEFRVEVAAPGMTRNDFRVDINEDNELLITMEKREERTESDDSRGADKQGGELAEGRKADHRDAGSTAGRKATDKKGTYLRREFSYSQFQQRLILPDTVEKARISAKVENGVLTVDIPKKKESKVAPAARRIEVK